jgi:hypothetical protein
MADDEFPQLHTIPVTGVAMGDIVQDGRNKELGTISGVDLGSIHVTWAKGTRMTINTSFAGDRYLYIGAVDARAARTLLKQLGRDMLDVHSAWLVVAHVDTSQDTACRRMVDAFEAWCWKALVEHRDSDLSKWKALLHDAARRIAEAGEAGDMPARLRLMADMVSRSVSATSFDAKQMAERPVVERILETLDATPGVMVDVQQMAYVAGLVADELPPLLADMCMRGLLVREDLFGRPTYGLPRTRRVSTRPPGDAGR